jgi:peroxiredoxin
MRKAAAAGSHSIGSETNVLGTGMSAPILDPSIFHGLADPMEPFLDGVRSIGISTVDGETCDIVLSEYEQRRRSRAFWIARRDRLPRRLVETVRLDREIVKREHWRAVSVNAAVPDDLFSWRPPAGWDEYRLPTLADGLLPPGSPAPDFTVTLLDGSRFTLSEQRGKTVWLCFWRLACPPCRVELPHLDRLQKRHGRNGLVVIGVNFADDRRPALEYLRAESIRFPNAVDTSAAVQDLYYRHYQTMKGLSAVPLNYIIDSEGRIADAWYGYEKGSNAGIATLKRLGIMR